MLRDGLPQPRTGADAISTTERSQGARRTVVAAGVAAGLAVVLYAALPPAGAEPPKLLEALGRFHTLAVHLPIGVLLLVASGELLSLRPKLRARVDPALGLALPFLVVTAVAAFSLGLLLAKGAGYPAKLVGMHRTFTLLAVVGSAATLAAWSLRERPDGTERRLPYRAALGATVALLTIGAHFGGSLTHGDTYLTKLMPDFVQRLLGAPPPPPPEPVAADPGAEPLVFASAILPLMKRECVDCHGPDKSKGGLRLDSLAAMLKGGDNGPAVLAGKGSASPMVKRMLLPTSDDDHMPPPDKPQPSSNEVELVKWWIDRGASETLRVRDALAPDGARTILGSLVDPSATSTTSALGATLAQPPSPTPTAAPVSAEPTPPAPAPAPTAGALAFKDVLAPMLASRCGKCHGTEKQKGKLRTDSLAALLAGGKSGAGIVPGDAARGTVLARLRLPGEDDKHMPPKEEPQLSPSQVEQLASWVAHGASEAALASTLPRATAAVAPPKVRPATPEPAASAAPPSSAAASAAPSSPAAPAVHVGPGQIALYRDVVAPVLVRRCGECHLGGHKEGGMRADDLPWLLKEKDIVPGKPDESPFAKRMALPGNDDNRMPPTEKPPAEAWEAAAVAFWIAQGATLDSVVAQSDLPASVAQAMQLPVAQAATAAAASAGEGSPSAAPAGTKVPLRASGCGSCAIGSSERQDAWGLSAGALAFLAAATRRRRQR